MVISIILLIGVGIGFIYIAKAVSDMRKQVDEKVKSVENFMDNPEEVIAQVGSTLVRKGIRRVRHAFKKRSIE